MHVLVWTYENFAHQYSSNHLYEAIVVALLDTGHEVTIIQPETKPNHRLPCSIEKRSVNILELPKRESSHRSLKQRYLDEVIYTLRAGRLIKKRNSFDVALVQSNNSPGIAVQLLNNLDIPCVYSEQDLFPQNAIRSGLLKNPLVIDIAKGIAGIAYKKATRIITISHDMACLINKQYACKEKMSVVLNWCRKDRNYLVSDRDNEFLKNNPIDIQKYRVVYAGNIGRMQDVEIIIRAAAILKNENVAFYIVGNGNNKVSLVEKTNELGLENVHFFDAQPEEISQDIYAAADLNIIPLLPGITTTCMPSKTAACICCRRPFIAAIDTDTWAASFYSQIPYGSVVSAGDASSLAEEILHCMSYYGKRYLAPKASEQESLVSEDNAYQYVDILEEVALLHLRNRVANEAS